jgi:ATP-dependent Clp protease ATP-binding subunit ClpC
MTSNLGTSDDDKDSFGFLREPNGTNSAVRARSKIEDALKRTFRPEFLNRIDEIIIFDNLTEGQIQEIVELLIKEVEERLKSHEVKIILTSAAKNWLSQIGFDPIYGARPLRRAVQRYVENHLSTKIISGEFEAGDMVFIDVDENGLTYAKNSAAVSTPA